VWPGELTEEQTEISALRQRIGNNLFCSLGRDVESHQGKPPENKSPKKPVFTEPTHPPQEAG